MDKFFEVIGSVSSATQNHAQQAVLEAGIYVAAAGLFALAITCIVINVANKAKQHKPAHHVPAE